MRKFISIVFIATGLIGCHSFLQSDSGEWKGKNPQTTKSDGKDITILRPENIPNTACLIDLGLDGSPVYQWVDYFGNLRLRESIYNHIYGFVFWDEYGLIIDTLYYEFEGSRENEIPISFKGSKIMPYPGDATIIVIPDVLNSLSDTLFMYLVNGKNEEIRKVEGKSFMRLCTVRQNDDSAKVSGYDIEINIIFKSGLYEVTTIGNEGIKSARYSLEGDCDPIADKPSYYDQSNRSIYFLPKDCILRLVD